VATSPSISTTSACSTGRARPFGYFFHFIEIDKRGNIKKNLLFSLKNKKNLKNVFRKGKKC
jgi:hypothetical protein